MTPQQAFFAPAEHIRTDEALAGSAPRCSVRTAGRPVLAPGEVISAPTLDYLVAGAAAGHAHPRRPSDPTMRTIRVVVDNACHDYGADSARRRAARTAPPARQLCG